MNKFTILSTKKYTPISYQEEYFHNKYELINSFMEDNLGDEFGDLLACPILKKEEVEWYSNFDSNFKRVSDFSKKEQDKILNIYWEKINKVIAFSQSFQSSKSAEKKKWAHLLNNVFNSDNNIIYSDGENVVLLWGWKFNASTENYVPPPGISTAKVIEDNTILNPIDEDSIPVIPIETKNNEPTILKLPWYILFWNWIKRIFRKFWWILLLLFILWFLLNLDGCSCNKTEHIDVNSYNLPIGIQDTINDNDQNNQPNNWNPENNNTGLEEEEFRQIVENNQPPELYRNLLIDENGTPRILPNKPRVHIPFNTDNLIEDENTHQMIISDRINIVLKGKDDTIDDFAKDFKDEFPSSEYQIIYKDDNINRIQIRVPEQERVEIKEKIKDKLSNYSLLIWDETIFQGSNFNDPGLKDKEINYYFENINMFDAWKKTTGNKDIIIAIIDDGFDLNHDELNDNLVLPYNVLYQNNKVYANSDLNHGTHVAGLAISEKNNGKGVCGIAPDCSFMPIQIANNKNGFTSSSIIDGILYAIKNGADVINLSIQVMYPPEVKQVTDRELNNILKKISRDDELFWEEIFEIANKKNVTIIFAAGNCEVLIGLDAMKRDNTIITVSAVDDNNNKANFSNYGRRSTISAPGVNIFSCKPGGQFVLMDGTSMSAPIIAGVVGLMKSINPNLTNKEIIEILQKSGKFVDKSIGYLVQVDKALDLCGNESMLLNQNKSINKDSIKNEIKIHEKEIKKLKILLK